MSVIELLIGVEIILRGAIVAAATNATFDVRRIGVESVVRGRMDRALLATLFTYDIHIDTHLDEFRQATLETGGIIELPLQKVLVRSPFGVAANLL